MPLLTQRRAHRSRKLTKAEKSDTTDITEDLGFQQKSWAVQRVAWLVMLAISAAALLGLFGEGPLSSAEVGTDGSGLRIGYDRFVRQEAPGTLNVHVGAAALRDDSTAQIWIDRKWLTEMEVKRITPEPESSLIEPDRIVYTFRVIPSTAPTLITWYLETHALGPARGTVGVSGGPSYSFSQFAYP